MASALTLIAGGRPVKQVCEVLGVARSNVAAKLARPTNWQDGRAARKTDDAGLVEEIRESIAHLPSYGYRRVWGLLRRQRENQGGTAVNAKRVYRVMRTHGLLLQRRPMPSQVQRRHDGKVAVPRSNRRWCSDGFGFRCENGEPLRVTFALDRCDREAMSWAATTGGHSGDVMLAAVENRFGDALKAPEQIEWLTDNGSGYIAERTRTFATELGLKPPPTRV